MMETHTDAIGEYTFLRYTFMLFIGDGSSFWLRMMIVNGGGMWVFFNQSS